MIDTHCHLLPGLDDGPRRLQASVALARQLVDCGVRQVICTPHFTRRYPTDHLTAARRLDELRAVLVQSGVPLTLGLATEIGSAPAWRMLDSGHVDILASDSHRAPRHGHDHLKAALALVAGRLGAAALRELTVLRPAGILAA